MPVRRIPKNFLFVTGRHASPQADEVVEFESILEKEYMLLLDSDPYLESQDVQPVEIPLSRGRIYVPDLLVTYRPTPSGNLRPPELVEIKTQEHLDRYADKYREKFAAAVVFAEERGWIFVTRTELDVRTPLIQNLKYLHRYRHTPADPVAVEHLLEAMRQEGSPMTPAALLGCLTDNLETRATWIPVLWHLVAHGAIQADLQVPLSESTPLSLPSQVMTGNSRAKMPTLLHVRKGSTVTHDGREYIVLRHADLNKVLAREKASDELVVLKLGSLEAPFRSSGDPAEGNDQVDLEDVSSEEWEVAQMRLEAIGPLLDNRPNRAKADYAAAAIKAGVGVRTIYNWLSAYSASELLSSLLPTRKNGGRGRSRLSPEVKLILDNYVREHHLTKQKPSVAKAAREIRRLCYDAGIEPLPAASTVYRHLSWLNEQESLKHREGRRAAEQRFHVNKGSIPDAGWPLALVQVDHTLLPVIIVDDKHRKSIGRAWITLAIDVFSRVCLGMYLTFDAPSAMSAGMCISHAILTKDAWMARMGCGDVEWPFYGVMDVLHLDNAREFRGKMLALAAREYHIDIHLRPVKQPRYGGHIERLMGTVSEELKGLKGATFANPRQKGEYDAEGNACMTFDELEKWLVLMFARYHRAVHSGIGTTPLTKWREGILGTREKIGRGLPPIRTDAEKVRIDFMPYVDRTIQDYGVAIDGIHYFHDILRPWVNARDTKNSRQTRQFRFRYDPSDMSVLYFFDPDLKRYFPIPYRDMSLPAASIWEIRAAKKMARDTGMEKYRERDLFALIARQREIEASAATKTKAARRAEQQRKQQAKARAQKPQDLPQVSKLEPTRLAPAIRGYDPDEIQPLSDDD